jgi:putative ABC transport system permease protein
MRPGELLLSLRWARRELRGGLRGFRIFLACLALGTAVIAGVGSLSSAVRAGLKHDAHAMLGGDVELHLVHRPATPAELAYFRASGGALSAVAQMRAMAKRESGDARSLIELKAVDDAYPLYGAVRLDPPQNLAAAIAFRDGSWGAVVAPELLDRLKLRLGDRIRVGDANFVLRAALAHEPDAITGGFAFGPRVMIAAPALATTGLVEPGALIGYAYRLRLPPGSDLARWIAGVKRAFPDAGWRIREFGNAAPTLQRLLNRVTIYMTLVGLTALLVGGVGVANAVRGYLAGKTETIATLKCLGSPARLIFATYLAQILALALLGIGLGVLLGALTPLLAAPLLAAFPIATQNGLYPAPLALAAAFGLLTTLAFALWPLAAAREVPAASLFRNLVDPAPRRPRLGAMLAVAMAGGALAALGVLTASDRTTAFWFVLGAGIALAAFRLLATLLVVAARRAGRPRHPGLRLALANLYRPGAPTAGVVASLGLGLTVLIAIALVQGNLAETLDERLPERAPSFFFLDIEPSQVAAFDRLVKGIPGVTQVERVPSLRGRITRLNGVPVERAHVKSEARWAISSERGLTYAATPPRGSRVVDGKWWPADYRGPTLVSMDAGIAAGMGLGIGDTITVNVLGREVTATIANLREIDWTSLGINFVLVFSPGILDGAPQMDIATARTPPGEEAALERAVTDRFPNVSAIAVKDALAAVSGIISAIAVALRAVAAVTLAAGTLVLAGAVAAGHRRRVYEAVVLKVLGATRADVTRAFLIEYGLLGLATAVIAAGLGTLAAFLVLTRVMHQAWDFLPEAVAATAVLATLLTVAAGYLGTWRALGAKPAAYLRNE